MYIEADYSEVVDRLGENHLPGGSYNYFTYI